MRDILISAGWFKYHGCTCGGALKEKYKHPDKPGKEVHIRPNRNDWTYLLNKRVVSRGNGSNLQDLINKI